MILTLHTPEGDFKIDVENNTQDYYAYVTFPCGTKIPMAYDEGLWYDGGHCNPEDPLYNPEHVPHYLYKPVFNTNDGEDFETATFEMAMPVPGNISVTTMKQLSDLLDTLLG